MAQTIRTEVGTGTQTVYNVNFDLGYLSKSHIHVYQGEDYTLNTIPFVFINDTQIQCSVPTLEEFFIRRIVPRNMAINDYTDGAILREKNLDDSFAQGLMISEEVQDGFFSVDSVPLFNSDLDMQGNRILNVGIPQTGTDAVRLLDLESATASPDSFGENLHKYSSIVFSTLTAAVNRVTVGGRTVTLQVGSSVFLIGRTLANDGKSGWYEVVSGVTTQPFVNPSIGGGLYLRFISGTSALLGRTLEQEYQSESKYTAGGAGLTLGGGVLILGDSITQGFGADGTATESYKDGYANKFINSIYNSVDNGAGEDRGYRFGSNLSLAAELNDGSITTTGSVEIAGGAVDSFIALTAGDTISITGREVAFSDVYYSQGSGTLKFHLNGVEFAEKTLVVSTGVVEWTFPTQVTLGTGHIRDTDVVTIEATGSCSITGLVTLRRSLASYSPHVIVAAHSGWSMTEFNNIGRLNNICDHMNLIRSSQEILVILNLGTNDIYNPGGAKSPSDYVLALGELVTNCIAGLTGSARFLVQVPPKAAAPTLPVLSNTYEEYVNAIVTFCEEQGHQMSRIDKTRISGSTELLFDTIHPNAHGATVYAQELCRTIGIPYNPHKHLTVDETSQGILVEASSAAEEVAAFDAGATAVVRLDLVTPDASLFLNMENTVTEDSSRIQHTGVITGTIPHVVVNAPVGLGSGDFSAGFIKYPHHPSFDLTGNQWGVEAFIKLTTNTSSSFIMSKGADGDLNNAWYFALLNTGGTALNVTFTSANNNAAISEPYPHELDLTNYHHISFNCDGVNVVVYIDGEALLGVPAQVMSGNLASLIVGGWNNDAPSVGTASGLLDNVVVSNTGPLRTANFTPPNGV